MNAVKALLGELSAIETPERRRIAPTRPMTLEQHLSELYQREIEAGKSDKPPSKVDDETAAAGTAA